MKDKININGIIAPIEVLRSKRKTLEVEVSSDGRIIVRSPARLTKAEIEDFILSKADRLEKYLREGAKRRKELSSLKPFTAEEINEMADRALKIIPERVRYYAPLIGVTYGKITIRNQKTRWGSCSAKGNLSFNCLLAAMPPEVLDSVVVHELCHLKQMNHSKDFYSEVYRVFPEYDRWTRWLKENGRDYIIRMTGEL
ncbi:MAG: M48 family metallopeptidase [Ruminococcus sp.]